MNDPEYWDAIIADYEAQGRPFTTFFAEAALRPLVLGPDSRALDIATGTGTAALVAARTGARVVAIDFSAGMVRRVQAHGLPNLDARQMNGQALDLPDATFDATLSIFGVMLFPDWRAGLREMARVTRPGGHGVVATWRSLSGAATNLLLADVRAALFPDIDPPPPPAGMAALSDPQRFGDELVAAGFENPIVDEITHDFELRLDALDDADRLFALIPLWATFSTEQRAAVLNEIRERAARARATDVLRIPSTALIGRATRPHP
jgi:SAM-dependent methyltransferase